MSVCYDTHEGDAPGRNVHTRGSEMVVHWKFCLVVKIERVGTVSFRHRNESFTANGVDVRDCDIGIDL